jgi:hypothetical protein
MPNHMINVAVPPTIQTAITAAKVPAAPVARILLQKATAKGIAKAIETHQGHAARVRKLKTKLMQGV